MVQPFSIVTTLLVFWGIWSINALYGAYNDINKIIDNLMYLDGNYVSNLLPLQIVKFNINIPEFDNQLKVIDLSYGFHNLNKNNELNSELQNKNIEYISGYDFLYIQAAHQYSFWFGCSYDDVIDYYKKAMDLYLNEKTNWLIY